MKENDIYNLTFTDEYKEILICKLNFLKRLHGNKENIDEKQEIFICENFNNLLEFLPIYKTTISKFNHEFKRYSINKFIHPNNLDKRLEFITQVQYPPNDITFKISYNRANLKKQSIFYAGDGSYLTLLEIQPEKDDLVTCSKWRLKENETLCIFSIFQDEKIINDNVFLKEKLIDFEKFLNNLTPNVKIVVEEIYKFIVLAFTSPVNSGNKVEYIFSALLADHIFNKEDVDLIYYPSVPNEFITWNIAVKSAVIDNKFELISVCENICINSIKNGILLLPLANSSTFDNGKIVWTNVNYSNDILNKFNM